MEVFEKDISLLKEYPKNNRKHSEAHIRKIAESIKRFGWRKPIEIDINNYIVAGHGRLKASKMLGLKTVPVVVTKDLEINNKAYRIFDNKITEAPEWDFENLEIEIQELKDEDFELESLGLDDFDINLEDDKEVQEVDVPEVTETNIKVGDLIELDNHRVLCGDATLEESYNILMDGKKADMVFTDPPYNIDYKGLSDKFEKIANDKKDDLSFINFLEKSLRLSKVNYICCSWQYYHLFRQAIVNIGQDIKAMIIWNKVNPAQHLDKYFKQHEIILYCGKLGGEKTLRGDIWEVKRERNTVHPTMKPISLISLALKDNPKSNFIYDSFLGSGSTLIASEQLGRTCYGMELEPKYCQVIIDRYLKLKPDAIIKINGEIWQKQEDQNLSQQNSKD